MKGLDLSNKQRILFALFCFALLGITYITLLPHPKLTTDVKRILNVPLQELRNGTSLKTCKHLRRAKGGAVFANMTVPSWSEVETRCVGVLPGGRYKPNSCVSESNVALVVPYRNREAQLRTFLKHIHPFLRNQFLNYRIVVVEMISSGVVWQSRDLQLSRNMLYMAEGITFNRGALFNVGFKEATKLGSFDCFILHDVDLLPEDNRNNYTCAGMPRHLSAAVDKFHYRLPYRISFGGAVAISARQFQAINGCSNMFYGWGGEDDDLYTRVRHKNMTVLRYPEDIARYKMIRHDMDQPANKNA